MLFSLVLAVASKEVELWQAFDEFAPRKLMDEDAEVDAIDEDQDQEEGDDDLDMAEAGEGEEGGISPLMVVPVVALVGGAAAYMLMNQGPSDEAQEDDVVSQITNKLQNDPTAQAAAGAGALLLTTGLYFALNSGPTGTPEVSKNFLATHKKKVGALATALGGVTLLWSQDMIPGIGGSNGQGGQGGQGTQPGEGGATPHAETDGGKTDATEAVTEAVPPKNDDENEK